MQPNLIAFCLLEIYYITREGKFMELYASLIVDIEKSKTYNVRLRNIMQNYLWDYIKILNAYFRDELEFEVTFSAGDEIQGLFIDSTSAYMYFRLLEMLLYPVRIRAGIGVGEWNVKINNGLSTQQDGPAYHRARQAIEEVYGSQLHNIKINSGGNDTLANQLINSTLFLKRQQQTMQNYVQILNEFVYPFEVNHKDISIYRDGALDIMSIKAEASNVILNGKKSIHAHANISIRNNYDIEEYIQPLVVDPFQDDVEEHIAIKNVQSTLGYILNSSRQNVANIMKRGNILKIRELDYVALQYLLKYCGRM